MEKNSSRIQFWVLNIASFSAQLAITMVNLALVYFLRYSVNASATVVGLAASTYTATYLIGCLFLSKLYQRRKPRHMIMMSVLGMSIFVSILFFTTNIILIFIALLLYGLAMSALWPQVESWITRGKSGKELTRATGAFNIAWSSASGVSPYIATLLIAFSPRIGMLGGIVLWVGVYLLILISSSLVPGIRSVKSETENVEEHKSQKDESTPLRFLSWITIFLFYCVLSLILNIFPLYAGEVLNFSESSSGFLLLVRGMATCIGFFYFGRVTWWQFKSWLIFLSQAVFAIVCFIFAFQTSFISFLIFFLFFGFILSLAYDFSIIHSVAGAINHSKRLVIHEVVLTCGTIIGASCGGYIYETFGFSNALIAIGITTLIFLFFEMVVWYTKKRQEIDPALY